MALPTTLSQAGISERLLAPAALFDDWLIAETEATLALAAWRAARSATKPRAHASYRAALDREEQASAVYAKHLNEVAHPAP